MEKLFLKPDDLPQLAVSRYSNQEEILASGLVPVRMTVGHPRFKLRYELGGNVPDLAPDRDMLKIEDREAFRARYREKVRRNALYITKLLNQISAKNDGRGLVLLCFEDLTKPDLWCHRTMLAEIFEESGVACPELPATAASGASGRSTFITLAVQGAFAF